MRIFRQHMHCEREHRRVRCGAHIGHGLVADAPGTRARRLVAGCFLSAGRAYRTAEAVVATLALSRTLLAARVACHALDAAIALLGAALAARGAGDAAAEALLAIVTLLSTALAARGAGDTAAARCLAVVALLTAALTTGSTRDAPKACSAWRARLTLDIADVATAIEEPHVRCAARRN